MYARTTRGMGPAGSPPPPTPHPDAARAASARATGRHRRVASTGAAYRPRSRPPGLRRRAGTERLSPHVSGAPFPRRRGSTGYGAVMHFRVAAACGVLLWRVVALTTRRRPAPDPRPTTGRRPTSRRSGKRATRCWPTSVGSNVTRSLPPGGTWMTTTGGPQRSRPSQPRGSTDRPDRPDRSQLPWRRAGSPTSNARCAPTPPGAVQYLRDLGRAYRAVASSTDFERLGPPPPLTGVQNPRTPDGLIEAAPRCTRYFIGPTPSG